METVDTDQQAALSAILKAKSHRSVEPGHGPYYYSISHHSRFYSSDQLHGSRGLWNALADNTTSHGYRNMNRAKGI